MSSSNAGQSAGQLETRGIEPVPEAECNGHPLQLFWVWFAANISHAGPAAGRDAGGVPRAGDLAGDHRRDHRRRRFVRAWSAIISHCRQRGGAPSLTLSRAVFGVRGNIGPDAGVLMSRLGWETVNTTTAAYVLLSLCWLIVFGTVGAEKSAVLTLVCHRRFRLLTLSSPASATPP